METENPLVVLAIERNKLALDRTFLAWIRTSLAGLGGGVALAKLQIFETVPHQAIAHAVGQFLILWGICLFYYALYDYRVTLYALQSTIKPKEKLAMFLTAIPFTIIALVLLWIV